MNYYNDNDEKVCEWLENLIDAKLIPPGKVDRRSITEVHPDELREYRQCHFFAGIAGWSEALRLAGWPDEWPVWTGSCPCQPFSVAGKGGGTSDERHLWPTFRGLIAECRPPVVFGEQVASKDGLIWLAGVRADLEKCGYVVGAADLPAASVGSPHIRQRFWWVAISECRNGNRWMLYRPRESIETNQGGASGKSERSSDIGGLADTTTDGHLTPDGLRKEAEPPIASEPESERESAGSSDISGLADTEPIGRRRRGNGDSEGNGGQVQAQGRGSSGGVGNTDSEGSQGYRGDEKRASQCSPGTTGFWSNFDLIPCKDGKARRVESGTFPLAHGVPGRVVKLRAYGNAIVPQLGAEWIETVMEYITEK